MANVNTLKTRLLMRYDTLTNWTATNPVLLKGEIAIVNLGSTPATTGVKGDVNSVPIVSMKVGDGTTAFLSLPFIQAVAGDVSSFIKSITGEDVFNEKVDARIANAKLATADELQAAIARIAQNETDIDALEAVVLTGDDSNAKLRASITANAATAKTQAETAESNAKAYADTQAAAAQSAAEATAAADATAKVNALANGAVATNTDAISAINSKIGETSIGDGTTITAAIKTLQDSIGTSGENSLGSRVDTLEGEMDTAQSDITDLQDRMATAEGEIDTLQAATQGYTTAGSIATAIADAKKAGTDAADAVEAETTRAMGVEEGLRTDVDKALAFLGTAVDTNDDSVIDTLKEIQDYIKSDETGAAAMAENIQKNTNAITTLNGTGEGSVAKQIADAVAPLASSDDLDALTNRVTTIETNYPTDIATAKSEAISTVVGTTTDASSADTVKGAKKYAEEKAAAAQTAATTAAAADATTKANQALTDAKAYTDTEIQEVNDAISALSAKTVSTTGEGLVEKVEKDSDGNIIATRRKVGVADMADEVFVFYCGESDGYSLTSVDI